MTQPLENNPSWQAGYAAGWAAYGDLMIEQLGPDGMVWRPIETAPKDGTWVLLTGGNLCSWDWDGESQPDVVSGQADGDGWSHAYYDGNYYGGYDSPTHWMPLPKPPR